jgi:hypothetical protein
VTWAIRLVLGGQCGEAISRPASGSDLTGNSFRLLEQALAVSVPREPAPLPETTAHTVARPAGSGRAATARAEQLAARRSVLAAEPGRGAPQGEGEDERPAGLGRCGQPLSQAQIPAAFCFDEEPAEQGREDHSHGRRAVAAQDQGARWQAPGGEGGPDRDADRGEDGPGEVL